MQSQAKPGYLCLQQLLESHGLIAMLECQHTIVRVADHDDINGRAPFPPLVNPEV